MKYYISDLHLGHANALKFDNRPFADLEQMHDVILSNWNNRIRNNDDVYILGDFAWRGDIGIEMAKLMKGRKHLIVGNHDRVSPQLAKEFASVRDYNIVKDGSENQFHVVLSHYPIAHFRNADYGYIHLYGHIHMGRDYDEFNEYVKKMKKRDVPYFSYNVGCMMPYMGYTPRTIYEITGLSETELITHMGEKPHGFNRADGSSHIF